MECPQCGLVNPDSADECDCGYDFVRERGSGGRPRSEAASRIAWVCVALGVLCPLTAAITSASPFPSAAWQPRLWLVLGLAGLALGMVGAAAARGRDPGPALLGFIAMLLGGGLAGYAGFAMGLLCE